MARKCELTGKGPVTGNKVSHSNVKTRTRWLPNLKDKKYSIPELGLILRLNLSARAIRTIDKLGGISNAIRQAKLGDLSPRLQSIRNRLGVKE
jgi:large subunit ribosomal protein L28